MADISPGSPFLKTLVLAEDKCTDVQSLQVLEKPMNSMITSRNGHDTESKALAMSTFSRIVGLFLAFNSLTEPWTILKLS
jgi:hypothetical protein